MKKTFRLEYKRPDDAEISVTHLHLHLHRYVVLPVYLNEKGIAIKISINILLNIYLKQKSLGR